VLYDRGRNSHADDGGHVIDDERARCHRCGRTLAPSARYQFHGPGGPRLACGVCALTDRPMLRRALMIAAVVGTVLVSVNQGDVLFSDRWPAALAWKIPLTYLVPFLVASWGALLAARVQGR